MVGVVVDQVTDIEGSRQPVHDIHADHPAIAKIRQIGTADVDLGGQLIDGINPVGARVNMDELMTQQCHEIIHANHIVFGYKLS